MKIELNPGIEIDGRRITTATVRLLSEAEVDALNQIEDIEERSQRCFTEQIASLGGKTDRERIEAFADQLTWPDEERLQRAMDELMIETVIASGTALSPSEEQSAGVAENVTGKSDEAARVHWMERNWQINRWHEMPDAKPKLRWLPFSPIVDTDDGRARFIAEHWELLAAHAFGNYLVLGRGCLVADLNGNRPGQPPDPFDPDGIGVGIEYLDAEHWAKNPARPDSGVRTLVEEEIIDFIKRYDPHREIVLVLLSRDRVLQSRKLTSEVDSPPEAFRRWSERAASFTNKEER